MQLSKLEAHKQIAEMRHFFDCMQADLRKHQDPKIEYAFCIEGVNTMDGKSLALDTRITPDLLAHCEEALSDSLASESGKDFDSLLRERDGRWQRLFVRYALAGAAALACQMLIRLFLHMIGIH